ncbi:MAG TPA: hypothetical protein PLJ21_07315 [Pseudobdellovibrionaceae bacterium]|nr:hypothetical protein [Pseudobdellovibrionaceae bacterium]
MKSTVIALALVLSQMAFANSPAAKTAPAPAAPAHAAENTAAPAETTSDKKLTVQEAKKECSGKKGAELKVCMKEKMGK